MDYSVDRNSDSTFLNFGSYSNKIQENASYYLHKAQESASCCGKKVASFAQSLFAGIKFVHSDANKFEQCCTKGERIIVMIETLKKIPDYFSKLKSALNATSGGLNCIQILFSIDYFANQRFKPKDGKDTLSSELGVAGMLAFTAVNIGSLLMWLEEMGVCSLSAIAVSLGEIKVFSFVPKVVASIPGFARFQSVAMTIGEVKVFSVLTKISIVSVISSTLIVAYGFFAVQSFVELFADGKSDIIRRAIGLDLVHYVAEMIFGCIVLSGAVGLVGLGIGAGVCLSLTIAAFLYKKHAEKQDESDKKRQLSNLVNLNPNLEPQILVAAGAQ